MTELGIVALHRLLDVISSGHCRGERISMTAQRPRRAASRSSKSSLLGGFLRVFLALPPPIQPESESCEKQTAENAAYDAASDCTGVTLPAAAILASCRRILERSGCVWVVQAVAESVA